MLRPLLPHNHTTAWAELFQSCHRGHWGFNALDKLSSRPGSSCQETCWDAFLDCPTPESEDFHFPTPHSRVQDCLLGSGTRTIYDKLFSYVTPCIVSEVIGKHTGNVK